MRRRAFFMSRPLFCHPVKALGQARHVLRHNSGPAVHNGEANFSIRGFRLGFHFCALTGKN